ncbi:MAG: DMT family transporter [Deltaproteobacteria bacterium]|nr:DMT family transporter [Deltaproteobacteria bacterium]
MTDRRRQRLAELLLASVTLFWGATFPMVKEAVAETPVLSFLGLRFLLSALLLALFAGPRLATLDRRCLGRGVFLGVLLFLSYLFQTLGLERTTASNTAFLTGLNVVWVPLLSAPLLRKRVAGATWVGVVAAVVGLLLLTWHTPWSLNAGDVLVVACSLFVALHILGLDGLTEGYDGRVLAFVQIATMAVLALAGSAAFEPVTWPRSWTAGLLGALTVTAVFATVYAFWVQTSFQRWTTPTRAALIYTLEPVFGALFSYLWMGERLGALGWLGGGLIVAGMVGAELLPKGSPPPPGPDGALVATESD